MKSSNHFNGDVKQIREAEEAIEKAFFKAVQDSDHRRELETYEQVRSKLFSLSDLTPEMHRERDRVLSYCLMRIDEALVNLGEEPGAVERTRDALEIAKKSEDSVQIARCSLAFGIRLLNTEKLSQAEEQFGKVFEIAEKFPDNTAIQEVLGRTLIVRGHILKGKSLYDQSLVVLQEAEKILQSTDSFSGVAQANTLMADVYSSLGDSSSAEKCREKAYKFHEKAKVERR